MMSVANKSIRRRIVATVLVGLLIGYVVSYLVLSRRGFAEAEAFGGDGVYFFPPEDTNTWRIWNYGLVRFYYPLILIDNWLGTGKEVACEPLWKLSWSPSRRTNEMVVGRNDTHRTACRVASLTSG